MTDNIAVTISMASAIVSFISVFFVWRQTSIQKHTIRAQLSTDLIMQKVLYLIFEDSIEFQRTSTGKFAIIMKGTDADICPEIDKVLNVFQIVGNLLSTKVLEKSDLRNLEYEIVSLGRNPVDIACQQKQRD